MVFLPNIFFVRKWEFIPFSQNSIFEKDNSLSADKNSLSVFDSGERELSFSKIKFWEKGINSHFLTKKYLAEIPCIMVEFVTGRKRHYINSNMIIEPKWSLRPGDWNLSAFSIISILVGATPSSSLIVSIPLSKLATFFSPLRRSASLVFNSGPLENSFKRCRTPNRNFCKAQTIYRFC